MIENILAIRKKIKSNPEVDVYLSKAKSCSKNLSEVLLNDK